MFRERVGEALDGWLASCSRCGIGVLESFAAGLRQDYAAARVALEEPWSNGQAEGQINRLKTLKEACRGYSHNLHMWG